MNDPNGIMRQEKIDEALKLIDKMIKHYEYYHGVFVTSNQPDKAELSKNTLVDLEKIKETLKK
jgi:hypothetical protein